MKLSKLKTNPNNPRIIKDDKFRKLVKSIEEFPAMMELRPIIINADNVILGGNMRFKALKELKYKEVPDTWVKRAETLTDDEQRRFIITDNASFGEHDWEMLNQDWDLDELSEWGLDIPVFENEHEKEIEDLSDKIQTGFKIEIECNSEFEQEQLYNELIERGIECRLLTL